MTGTPDGRGGGREPLSGTKRRRSAELVVPSLAELAARACVNADLKGVRLAAVAAHQRSAVVMDAATEVLKGMVATHKVAPLQRHYQGV